MDWRVFICGFCFGVYPLFANRSKLSYGAMLFIFSLVLMIGSFLPFVTNGSASMRSATKVQLSFMLIAAVINFGGSIFMFKYLADAPPMSAGGLVLIMVIMQVVTTWTVSSLLDGARITVRSIFGLLAALATVILLKR